MGPKLERWTARYSPPLMIALSRAVRQSVSQSVKVVERMTGGEHKEDGNLHPHITKVQPERRRGPANEFLRVIAPETTETDG